MESFINLIQRRIANISIGPSALRGQTSGTIKKTRDFLINLDLNIFKNINSEKDYIKILDRQTELLQEKIPSKSWGISRKALNLFLFHSSHDIFLNKNYNFNKIIPFLEITLDNPNAKKLIVKAKERGIELKWNNIKSLKKEMNENFQNIAKIVAKEEYNWKRCYLDLKYWRGVD